jgi:endogenous inhibitor of DNA gyrase (YacG/DUF329 family)
MSRKIILDKDYFVMKDEWYGEIYKCPHCEHSEIWSNFNYCPNCGYKIEWKVEMDE